MCQDPIPTVAIALRNSVCPLEHPSATKTGRKTTLRLIRSEYRKNVHRSSGSCGKFCAVNADVRLPSDAIHSGHAAEFFIGNLLLCSAGLHIFFTNCVRRRRTDISSLPVKKFDFVLWPFSGKDNEDDTDRTYLDWLQWNWLRQSERVIFPEHYLSAPSVLLTE
jgi:hypothetical protein